MQYRHILLCALGLGCVGLTLYIVGFVTPEWFVDGDLPAGYWIACKGGLCRETENGMNRPYLLDGSEIAKLMAGRASHVWGILSAAGGLVLVFLKMVRPSVHSSLATHWISLGLMAIAGIRGLFGVSFFCATWMCTKYGGYSLALNVAGSCILIASTIVTALDDPSSPL